METAVMWGLWCALGLTVGYVVGRLHDAMLALEIREGLGVLLGKRLADFGDTEPMGYEHGGLEPPVEPKRHYMAVKPTDSDWNRLTPEEVKHAQSMGITIHAGWELPEGWKRRA